MKLRTFRYFVGDFETTVDGTEYQGHTEVWASASVELGTENVIIVNSIQEQFNYFVSLDCDLICYYHNLKFDGNFWLYYLLADLKMKQGLNQIDENGESFEFDKVSKMKNNTFIYSISDMGQWYSITIKINNHIIEFRDSLKLLPFSVKRIGDSFKTKHKKLEMEYVGDRYAGCVITDEEKEYIANDVLVVKEALEIMFQEGHNKLTIGSCCLAEFKSGFDKKDYEMFFPDLTQFYLDPEVYGSSTADEYIRKSYKGGWCYVVKGKENQMKYNGCTLDVNSLYPSMMSGESGNYYPVGKPYFWKGEIPEPALKHNRYYFVRIRTHFRLKKNKLPFIQIKGSLLYKGTEMLETDAYLGKDGKYHESWIDYNGEVHSTKAELTLTMTDYQLIKEHYDLIDCEVLDGCFFQSEIGIFDNYIEKYRQLKMTSKGAKRELAKLFLNNLYGKLASSMVSSFKIAYLKDEGIVGFKPIYACNKKAGYIACGSAITSYARNFTIRTAQANYYGKSKRGFIYADTDSIHCDLTIDEIKGVTLDDNAFCCWKAESNWDKALFVRQKTYIEHVVAENRVPLNENDFHYLVRCAGMPEKCKDLFIKSITNYEIKPEDKFTEKERMFIEDRKQLEDFKKGLIVPAKLLPKNVKGGVLLIETCYEMR